MTRSHDPKNEPALKAGALLCPVCCVEYIEAEVDFEVDGKTLRHVKVLRCPVCEDEQFTPQQREVMAKWLRSEP
ncbi:MAG: hypothetical protein ACE14S_03305 [Candidatus Bathyarchaeia archaeon]